MLSPAQCAGISTVENRHKTPKGYLTEPLGVSSLARPAGAPQPRLSMISSISADPTGRDGDTILDESVSGPRTSDISWRCNQRTSSCRRTSARSPSRKPRLRPSDPAGSVFHLLKAVRQPSSHSFQKDYSIPLVSRQFQQDCSQVPPVAADGAQTTRVRDAPNPEYPSFSRHRV